MLLIVRHHTPDLLPEARRMVLLKPVAKLVHDNIVKHRGRNEREQAVEIQISRRGAAPPPCALGAHGHSPERDADERRKVRDALRRQEFSAA